MSKQEGIVAELPGVLEEGEEKRVEFASWGLVSVAGG
jgi:hypothetical protein